MLIHIAAVVTAYYLGRCGVTVDELFRVLQVMIDQSNKQKMK